MVFSEPIIINSTKDSTTINDPLSDDAKTWKYGIEYNYCAASAGSYCYGDGKNGTYEDHTTEEDICPKNWRIPTGGGNESEGDYNLLKYEFGYDTGEKYRNALRLPIKTIDQYNRFSVWWSSTRESGIRYYLYAETDWVQTDAYDWGYEEGFNFLRCVLGSY